MKKKSGQILILILLIVVVALAVGLSVASRNITNLRTSTQAEHSQRALSAAEGGVEDTLSKLSTFVSDPAVLSPSGKNLPPLQVGGLTANVNVKGSTIYESTIEPGEIGQVDLSGATGVSNIQIEWAKKPTESNPASIEATLVKNVSGTYSQTRKAWSTSVLGRDEQGFADPDCPSTEYFACATMPFEAGAVLLRIKPFWERATVKVTCIALSGNCTLPTQVYQVVSEAQTEIGVTRKIQVTRTALPQLPAAFDYVLYSEGPINK